MKVAANGQQGIALITVMLVLAIATVAVVSMSSARQLDIRRTENQLRSGMAWEYAHGLESWAAATLDRRLKKTGGTADAWPRPLVLDTVGGGVQRAEIEDLQGRINLNNLLLEGKASPEDVRRLKRLLANLKLETNLVDAIVDWIDADIDAAYPHGAEDDAYMRLQPPYRAANRQFADVSELLLVRGMTREIYDKLSPHVYAVDGYAPLNVNTASATVLRCLADNISQDLAESIFRARGKPFAKVGDFLKDEAVAAAGIGPYGLGVNSNNFLLKGQIEMANTRLGFESYMQRAAGKGVQILRRQRQGMDRG